MILAFSLYTNLGKELILVLELERLLFVSSYVSVNHAYKSIFACYLVKAFKELQMK